MAVRTLVVHVGDWSVLAARVPPAEPAAVLRANRVVACSPAARNDGVVVGQRRREAQGRCPARGGGGGGAARPALGVAHPADARDARLFEAVVATVESFTPRIEITRPGVCALTTRGPSRYFGGDRSLADQVLERVDALLAGQGWPGAVGVGVADGPFAAGLAAEIASGRAAGLAVKGTATAGTATAGSTTAGLAAKGTAAAGLAAKGTATAGSATAGSAVRLVPPDATAAFLAPFPVGVLDRAALGDADGLVDVLERLGLGTLGAIAALPAADLVARFGLDGRMAHRLARGLDERPPDSRIPPPMLRVETEIDPPADRIDVVAFAAKALADDLHGQLDRLGLACTRVAILAETEHGESLERVWRHEGALAAGAIADRVRWQLDGWLNGSAAHRPTSGISLLALVPDEVMAATGRQLGFWGGETAVDDRAERALARVQGLLGPDAVTVPEWRGGRGPGEQVVRVPVHAVDLTGPRPGRPGARAAPWPGRLPAPAPAVVHPGSVSCEVVDAESRAVGVSGRGLVSAPPARLSIRGGPWVEVSSWAGPWPVDERWWDPPAHRRRARFQVVVGDGRAHLLSVEGGRWWVEATYD
jgi:protein ImuB